MPNMPSLQYLTDLHARKVFMPYSFTRQVLAKQDLLSEARAVMPGGINSCLRHIEPQIIPVKAVGAYFDDIDGKRYIDYHGAFGPPILGHADPTIADRVTELLADYDIMGVGVSILEIQLARKLVEHVPSIEKVLLCNSGSEATYHALRLCRAVTGRKKVLKFQGCYHGFHDSIALNVISPASKIGCIDPLSTGSLSEVLQNTIVCGFNDLDQVEDAAKKHSGRSRRSFWNLSSTISAASCRKGIS